MLRYTLRLDRPAAHLFGVDIEADTLGASYLDLEFPAWSPGRYFIYDFARNVQELGAAELAAGGNGRNLAVERRAKGTWRIACEGVERVRISYRMFGDTLSGTFSQLDDRHAAVNGSSVFGYIVGRTTEEILLHVEAPTDWTIHTAMKRRMRGGRSGYWAANYDQLIDSPIEAGRPRVYGFTHDGVRYHVVLDIAAPMPGRENARSPMRRAMERYVADLEKIVAAYTAVFGRPEFDAYYFLVNIDPYAQNGDGMEHQASTRLVLNGSLLDDDNYNDLIDVSSHEFFHIWNVKRMRPAELGPFNYTQEQHTTLLWFAEGFTQYYGHLMARRAGVVDDRQFFKELVSEINAVDRSPGRFHRDLRASSFDTWHALSARNPMAATSNFKNTYVNYYHKGAVTAFLLDMEIRRRSHGRRSLDDVVRELYRSSYAEAPHEGYYMRGVGYSERDVLDATARIAGPAVRAFLERMITSTGEVDYRVAMRYVGLDLTRGRARRRGRRDSLPELFTGLVVPEPRERGSDPFVRVVNVLSGSPAERAGLSAGDVVLAIDGQRVDGRRWETVLAAYVPGDVVDVALFRGARLLHVRLSIEELDTRAFKIEPLERATTAQKSAREKWLRG